MSDHSTQKIREGLTKITAWAVAVVKQLEELEKKEIPMGKAADAINDLQAINATQAATITSLQTQLATAQANEYDAADEAAISAVLTPAGTGTGTGTGTGN